MKTGRTLIAGPEKLEAEIRVYESEELELQFEKKMEKRWNNVYVRVAEPPVFQGIKNNGDSLFI